jgi:hypothetical protein
MPVLFPDGTIEDGDRMYDSFNEWAVAMDAKGKPA